VGLGGVQDYSEIQVLQLRWLMPPLSQHTHLDRLPMRRSENREVSMSRLYVAGLAAASVLLLAVGLMYGRMSDDRVTRASPEEAPAQAVGVAEENPVPPSGSAKQPSFNVVGDFQPPDFAFGPEGPVTIDAPLGGIDGVRLTSPPEWAKNQQVFTRSPSALPPATDGGVAVVSSIKYHGDGNRLTVTYGEPDATYWQSPFLTDENEVLDDGTLVFTSVVDGDRGPESMVFLAQHGSYVITLSGNLPLDDVREYADQLHIPAERAVE